MNETEINEFFKRALAEINQRQKIDQQQEVKPNGKLTKLSQQITGMGDKMRGAVANKWHNLRNLGKKRKFIAWCKEQNIFGVHVEGGNGPVDYDALQRNIQQAIDNITQGIDIANNNLPERER